MFPYPPSTTQDLNLLSIHNRRLLLHSSLYYHHPPPPSLPVASPPSATETDATPSSHTTANGFDANVIMVLSVLLCALFCSLGLNSIVRCALGCSTYVNRNRNHENSDEENRRISAVALAKRGGIGKKALKMFPKVSFSTDLDLPGLDTDCAICLSEFMPGERVRLLPKCNHGFHVKCIDRWLGLHTSCPTCRCCLVETCRKIVGRYNQASSSELPVPPPIVAQAQAQVQAPAQAGAHELVLNVAPLEREDMIHTSSNTTS